MKKQDLLSKVIEENFILVAISTGLTMNEYHHPIVMNLIEESTPDYFQLLNPEAYLAYFRSKHSASQQHAKRLLTGIQDLILRDDKFEDFKVGINEGNVITEVDSRGRITFLLPIGEALRKISNNAKGKQDLAQQSHPADPE